MKKFSFGMVKNRYGDIFINKICEKIVLLFIKQVVNGNLRNYVFGICISLQAVCCNKCWYYTTGKFGLLFEKCNAVCVFLIFFFCEGILFLAIFCFADVCHSVGTFDNEVYLGFL